ANATLLASVNHNGGLAAGASYNQSVNATIPATADGSYRLFLVTDAANAVTESNEGNNQLTRDTVLQIRHADLKSSFVSAPATASSGSMIAVQWTTANVGTAATPGGWVDRLYLSSDPAFSGDDRL